MDSTFRLRKKKNDYDEYTVEELVNGKYREAGSYHTDDWEDAVGTLKDIARRRGLTVKPQGNGYIADSVKDEFIYKVKKGDTIKVINLAPLGKDIPLVNGVKTYTFDKDYTFYGTHEFHQFLDSRLSEIYNSDNRSSWRPYSTPELNKFRDSLKTYKIGNYKIQAKDEIHAVKLYKVIDSLKDSQELEEK